MPDKAVDLTGESPGTGDIKDRSYQISPPLDVAKAFDLNENRETTRGDLARGLLWLLTFAIGGVLAFIGLGLIDGSVLTQSIFPSLVALAGTALGFYFGSQNTQTATRPVPPIPGSASITPPTGAVPVVTPPPVVPPTPAPDSPPE